MESWSIESESFLPMEYQKLGQYGKDEQQFLTERGDGILITMATILTFKNSSSNTANNLLLQSRPRTVENGLPRPKDVSSVRIPTAPQYSTLTSTLLSRSPSAFQGYITAFTSAIRNPRSLFNSTAQASSMSPEKMLGSIRNLNSAQLLTGGVAVAEVLGFFTVGEMIGRMKMVGETLRGKSEGSKVYYFEMFT